MVADLCSVAYTTRDVFKIARDTVITSDDRALTLRGRLPSSVSVAR